MFEADENQQDANTTVESSEPQQSPAESSVESSAPAPEKAAAPTGDFHTHPRWIEREEQLKSYKSELESTKAQIAEMQKQFQSYSQEKQAKAVNPLVQRLGQIDPEFGKTAEQWDLTARDIQEIKEWKQQMDRERVISQYEGTVSKLYSEHKVPAELQEFYKAQLDAMAIANPKLSLSDLPAAFKSVHDKFSKFVEGTKRAERASYVKDKTKDSAVPASQPKGKPAGGPKSSNSPTMDREELRAIIAKEAVRMAKAEKDV